jgi:chemotaxis protein CheY
MGKNILIEDDSAFMRMILKGILTKDGYNVVGEATNGKEAINKYNDLKPDLVAIDITMPEVDGLQALKQIMEIDHSAKVIMCSEMGQNDMVIEAIQAGAKDFIVKPFQADKVKKTIKKVFISIGNCSDKQSYNRRKAV